MLYTIYIYIRMYIMTNLLIYHSAISELWSLHPMPRNRYIISYEIGLMTIVFLNIGA